MLWNAERCAALRVFDGVHMSAVSECVLVPGKNSMVSVSWDKTMVCWDLETGQTLWTSSCAGLLTSCSTSCDGRLVVCSADMENALYVTEATSGETIHHVRDHHKSTITRCRFDPQGQHVASVSADRTIKLWDLVALKTTMCISSNHNNVISSCCFTGDGRLLCTSSWDKSLQLWDLLSGSFRSRGGVALHRGHAGSVSACSFSGDGELLVSGSYDKTVALWDMSTLSHTLILKGHNDWVTDVSISADKKWVASASKDGTMRLWNTENVEEIPEAVEKRRGGMGIHKCEQCGKAFSVPRLETSQLVSKCVFCRLKTPERYRPQPPPLSSM
ncbi:WD repeat-containing protein 88-like [Polymixia lowei]